MAMYSGGMTTFSLFMLVSVASAQAREKITMVCSEFPPAKMQSSADGLLGYDVDILLEAFKSSNFDVSTVYLPWKRAVETVKSGKYDGLCSCSYVEDRNSWAYFSRKMGNQEVGYFYNPKSNQEIKSVSDISGYSVGVARSYNLHQELMETEFNIIPVNDAKNGLRMLLKDRIGAFFSFRNTGEYILSRLPGGLRIKYFELRKSPYYACFGKASKNSILALNAFNKGLSRILADGTYNSIFEKYK